LPIPILTISTVRLLTLPHQLWDFVGFMRVAHAEPIFAGTLMVSLTIIELLVFLQRHFTSTALKQ